MSVRPNLPSLIISLRGTLLRGIALAAAVFGASLATLSALADDAGPYDARIENYEHGMQLDPSGTALMWVLFIVLALFSVGVMFINSKRSHLD